MTESKAALRMLAAALLVGGLILALGARVWFGGALALLGLSLLLNRRRA